MPIAQAVKLCPHGIFMRGNWERYAEASRKVRAVIETVSPVVQFASIDEAYIDITGSLRLFGGDDAIAAHIKSEIRTTTALPCTVAISSNKLVSKVASDFAKPDGYINIPPGGEAAFFAPLAVGKLPGIGPKMREALHARGVNTLGELAELPEKTLEQWFGPGARSLQRRARGESNSKVEVDRIPKSMSRETTFAEDLRDWKRIENVLTYLTERTAYALREQGMEARSVTLKVRYAPFDTKTFAHTLPEPTALDRDIFAALEGLVAKAKRRRDPVRLIGVGLTQLTHGEHQLALFGGESNAKWTQALKSVDAIRARYGFETLRTGRAITDAPDEGVEA
jgi:DNA polymerase-4